jgi:hypothetical protein
LPLRAGSPHEATVAIDALQRNVKAGSELLGKP